MGGYSTKILHNAVINNTCGACLWVYAKGGSNFRGGAVMTTWKLLDLGLHPPGIERDPIISALLRTVCIVVFIGVIVYLCK